MISFRQLKQMDYLLLLTVTALLIGGWFILYSASLEEQLATGIKYAEKQFIWVCISLIVFFIMVFIDYHFLLKISFIIYGITIVLLILVLIVGEKHYGAQRWISFGAFAIQPSELAKIGVLLAVSRYLVLDIENRRTFKYILICGLLLLVPLFLILKQPDLGMTLIFIPTILIMLFVAGIKWRYIILFGITSIAGMPLLWSFLKEYQKKRVLSFLNPESDPLGAGYSLIQSKIAVGSGGVLGKGWLSGTQNRLNFIPERHTDFIFSVIGEEWGFIGAVIVLLLFFIVLAIGFSIARKAPDISGRILSVGLISMFGVQVVINISMTLGLMPVTGITLPFISYGGTSLVVTMAMMGLLENIYMRRFMF